MRYTDANNNTSYAVSKDTSLEIQLGKEQSPSPKSDGIVIAYFRVSHSSLSITQFFHILQPVSWFIHFTALEHIHVHVDRENKTEPVSISSSWKQVAWRF